MKHSVRVIALCVALLCWPKPAGAQSYVGAGQCAQCHPVQFERQSLSSHAHSLYPAAEHPLVQSFVPKDRLLRRPDYVFEFSRIGKQLRVKAFDAKNVLEVPIDWAFGAGRQAVTFVTRVNDDWYLEHYHSYYPALASFAPTPGHEAITPKSLPEAMGIPYTRADPKTGIKACFECHSTGPVTRGEQTEIRPSELGVRCESCHGPGSLHVEAAKEGRVERARRSIQRPGRGTLSDLNRFCGTCHRPPAGEGSEIDWGYAWNVRHQPAYLARSACYLQSKGELTCLTCHDPHGPMPRKDAANYDSRCRSCHQASGKGIRGRPPKAICESRKPADCADCHMPRVSPQTGLAFSNHWIGVYGSGAKLKPSARAF